MSNQRPSLTGLVARLEECYGRPPPPLTTDPFEMVLWENVAYLVPDERRAVVYEALAHAVGTTPQAILAEPEERLAAVIEKGGVHALRRAGKLRTAAEIAIDVGPSELRKLVRDAPRDAKKVLKRFPSIGDPGADKILLFARSQVSLAPDSNALRVLIRLGYGDESDNYGRTYRSVAADVEPELPDDFPWLITTHLLLRRHGQELCKRSAPHCEVCPIAEDCTWYRSRRRA